MIDNNHDYLFALSFYRSVCYFSSIQIENFSLCTKILTNNTKYQKRYEIIEIFKPLPDPLGKEKEKLKRALKVISEGDDIDKDDVLPGPISRTKMVAM